MAKTTFGSLTAEQQQEALATAARMSGRHVQLLEKDVWVVQTMAILFGATFGDNLVLKGGTSLSKAYNVIHRFSEDIDVTYDVRAFAPDLVSRDNVDNSGIDPIPQSGNQAKRWKNTIDARLNHWVANEAVPIVRDGMTRVGFNAEVEANGPRLRVIYRPSFEGHSFILPEVMVDFGARSTGAPHQVLSVVCDASGNLPDIELPTVSPAVMSVERTFWEKATAIHVFCLQERVRGERFSRHWHDLMCLKKSGYHVQSQQSRDAASVVARHKTMFFRENDSAGNRVDYHSAVSGQLRLVPSGEARDNLKLDYNNMLESGMLFDAGETFEQVLEECTDLESTTNRLILDDNTTFSPT